MTIVADISPLTTDQAKAIRSADYIVFHYREGRSYLRACKEKVGVWKATHEIEIDCGIELSNSERTLGKIRSASHIANFLDYRGHVNTVIQSIRKGDKLTLSWRSGNNNNVITNAGLYQDELHLIIDRNGKKSYYMIAVQVSPNNTARMVKQEQSPVSILGD